MSYTAVRTRLAGQDEHEGLATASHSYRRVVERVTRFAPTTEPVVLQGESGTGKTWLAKLIHRMSGRHTGPYHSINIGEMDDSLAASHLFGHLAGAYTDARTRRHGAFESARKGTLFLDEIGKASTQTQQKLLTVIESTSFYPLGSDVAVTADVRLILAASEPLATLARTGRMLGDLVARLGPFRIELPPLRERREDIPDLCHGFVRRHARAFGYPADPPELDPALVDELVAYHWPCNVRELDQLIRRLLVDAEGAPRLGVALLRDDLAIYRQPKQVTRRPIGTRASEIARALQRNGGNKSAACRELQIGRSTLHRHVRNARDGDALSPSAMDPAASGPRSSE